MKGVESIEEKVLAVLHDVLEDSDVSREQLIKHGIPEYLVQKLEILCKGKNEKYFDYIDRNFENKNISFVMRCYFFECV